MSTPSAGCSSPIPAMERSPLLAAAMKRKKRVADVRRRLDFDSDSEVDCCTPPPSRKSTENVTVTVQRRLYFDSAVLSPPQKIRMKVSETVGRKLDFDSAVLPPPQKIRMKVWKTVVRKLDFDSADASTPPRARNFECAALRRFPPPDFPSVRWNMRAMKSYFNNAAPINLR